MKWRAQFTGRPRGTRSKYEMHDIELEGHDRVEATVEVYRTHEHVHHLVLIPMSDDPSELNQ